VVSEGLLAFLGRDLRENLEAGFRRTPAIFPDGSRWLTRWASISLLVGLTLFLFCGYHGGFARINSIAASAPGAIWQWLTMLGDERVAFALTLFFTRRYPKVFWTLVAAALFGFAFTHSLKPLFSALRPPAALDAESFNLIGPGRRKQSFPSGHTVTAAIFFGVWIFYVRSSFLRWLLVLFAVAAGLRRVALGVHWPMDVAMGLAGGALAAWLGVRLADRAEMLGRDPSIHLAFVTVAAVMAVSLLLWDGGYHQAAQMQNFLAIATLSYAGFVYVVAPVLRWLRS